MDKIYYLVYSSGLQCRSNSHEWGVKYSNWVTENVPDWIEACARRLAQQVGQWQQLTATRVGEAKTIYWLAMPGKDDLERANIFGLLMWQDNNQESRHSEPAVASLLPPEQEILQQALHTLRHEMLQQDGHSHIAIKWDPLHTWQTVQQLTFVQPINQASDVSLEAYTSDNSEQAACPLWLWLLAGLGFVTVFVVSWWGGANWRRASIETGHRVERPSSVSKSSPPAAALSPDAEQSAAKKVASSVTVRQPTVSHKSLKSKASWEKAVFPEADASPETKPSLQDYQQGGQHSGDEKD